MDFLDWCDSVLEAIRDGMTESDRFFGGLSVSQIGALVFGPHSEEARTGKVRHALRLLHDVGFITQHGSARSDFYQVTYHGERFLVDKSPEWTRMADERLLPEWERVLLVVNRESPQFSLDGPEIMRVALERVRAELGLPWSEMDRLSRICTDLNDMKLVKLDSNKSARIYVEATYKGLVWETRREFLRMNAFIDELVDEGETTNTELKSEVIVRTDKLKAKLLRSVLALANTQCRHQSRWLLIGFDSRTHEYTGMGGTVLTPDQLEDLMSEYTIPMVETRYREVRYRKGTVGMLEVRRDRLKLPYRAARDLGGANYKHRIEQDKVYVRHGSHNSPASDDEIQSLVEEASLARQKGAIEN